MTKFLFLVAFSLVISATYAQDLKEIEKYADDYYLRVPGIAINDNYQVVDDFGAFNKRIYMMAVPYIGGFNPDYSGLDFCEAASNRIAKSILY